MTVKSSFLHPTILDRRYWQCRQRGEDVVYISSGTWSLMGVERKEPDCSLDSMKADFTNEGGYDHRYRYLRNIMGLWMIQSVKKVTDRRSELWGKSVHWRLRSRSAQL